MALRKKIDSNESSAYIAKEVLGAPGTLLDPDWVPLEPNEWDDFGGEYTLEARNPINAGRQRKKGNIVDLEATGGFNQDMTLANTMHLFEGFVYANTTRRLEAAVTEVTATGYEVADETLFKAGMIIFASGFATAANNGRKVVVSVDAGSSEVRMAGLVAEAAPPAAAKITLVGMKGAAGVIDVNAAGSLPIVSFTAGLFDEADLEPGDWIFIGGDAAGSMFADAGNNGPKRLRAVDTASFTIDKTDAAMVTVADTLNTVEIYFGHSLKNEAELINQVRQTYQIERQLGAPDAALPGQIQAEYIKGAYPDECTINVESASKLTIDWSFVALSTERRAAAAGPKAGDRLTIEEQDFFNTSSDFSRMRLGIYTAGIPGLPLFNAVTDLTLTIANNVSLNKAVAVLGGYDATIGTFEVGAEMNAYLLTLAAIDAVADNADVTFDWMLAKDNRGFIMDYPLGALGDGKIEIEQDEPGLIPLEFMAATGVKISPDFNYTVKLCHFDYLPTVAQTIQAVVT